jgi:putative copper resistance protein D
VVQTSADTAERSGRLGGVVPLVVIGAGIAAFVAAGLTALSGSAATEVLGLPDPGMLTRLGLPVVKVLGEIAAVLTVGALWLASFGVPAQRSGTLDAPGYRAVRAASYAAALWAAAALLMIPLTVADALGRPVDEVLSLARLYAVVPQLSTAQGYVVTAVVALVVFAGSRMVLTWGPTVGLLALAVFGLLPVAANGHSAAGGSHDVATDSLLVHIVAAALWVGGLAAVLGLAARRDPGDEDVLPLAVSRFSRLAFVCWFALAFSGVINVYVRLPLSELFGTAYGGMVLAKVGALVVLGVLGFQQRRRSVPAVLAGRPGSLLRFGAAEVLIMLATIGVAVALGRTAPLATAGEPPSTTELLIGYPLDWPPTPLQLLIGWRFDLIFGTLSIVGAVIYLRGVLRLRARGDRWPIGRTIAWLGGCLIVLVASSSGIGRYATAMFSVHMAEHMMLSMLAPILLVLGAPLTLALRAIPPSGPDAPPGAREWLLAAVHSTPARWLTNPLITLPLFVGSYYALYLSNLFGWAVWYHSAHTVMRLHFLIVGFLFFWPLIGVDPAPRRLPPVVRLGVLFLSVPFHAFFGVALMNANTPIAEEFYRTLALPWVPDLLADQRLGGGLAWAAGEIPLLIVLVALLVQWARADERSARRADRKADADGDAELNAYNAMLRQLADSDRSRSE